MKNKKALASCSLTRTIRFLNMSVVCVSPPFSPSLQSQSAPNAVQEETLEAPPVIIAQIEKDLADLVALMGKMKNF
jgi:hypothetical protein